jgi:hypothetical protein
MVDRSDSRPLERWERGRPDGTHGRVGQRYLGRREPAIRCAHRTLGWHLLVGRRRTDTEGPRLPDGRRCVRPKGRVGRWLDVWRRTRDRPTPPVVEHYDGNEWQIIELPKPPAEFAPPLAVTAVSPQDVWISGWTGPSNEADRYAEQRALVAHWNGNVWTYPDIGLDQPPQVVWGASETGGNVFFVGSEGGSFSGTMSSGSIQGDHPLASFGVCRVTA